MAWHGNCNLIIKTNLKSVKLFFINSRTIKQLCFNRCNNINFFEIEYCDKKIAKDAVLYIKKYKFFAKAWMESCSNEYTEY